MTPEKIVRALAAADPMQTYEDDCALCSSAVAPGDPHEPDCPWRLAVEWVASHEPYECIRCGLNSDTPFTRAHRAPDGHPRAGLRTCGGTVVPSSQVVATREAERLKLTADVARMRAAESGWRARH